jgi:hypothetical protein
MIFHGFPSSATSIITVDRSVVVGAKVIAAIFLAAGVFDKTSLFEV